MENKKLGLLEKIGLGAGIVGMIGGFGFAGNGSLIMSSEIYKKLNTVQSTIRYVQSAKNNLEETEYNFCLENFDAVLDNLSLQEKNLKISSEYKALENKRMKNSCSLIGTLILGVGGFMTFALRYNRKSS